MTTLPRAQSLLVLSVGTLILSAAEAAPVIDPAAFEALQKQVKALTEEVQRLKGDLRLPRYDDELDNNNLRKAKGLSFTFYGESKYRFPEAGRNSFDAHRYVLAPSYQINDWLVFNSALELEHGGMDESTSRGSRFNGEFELEQFYVDILLHKHFNVRSLGIDLVPVGRINKFHEPTVFYSTERPELYREIIPSTWMEPSIGAFGKITDTLDYQIMISLGLEDFSSSAAGAGITPGNGMRDARPRLRGQDENSLAYSGRLHYHGLPGLDASTSFYVTETRGFDNKRSLLALGDIEALYGVPKTGLELRGDFAYWHIDRPEALIVNNGLFADAVGDQMYGWYLEAAYHLWPDAWKQGRGSDMDLVPFLRFSQIVTQSGLSDDDLTNNSGNANRDFITTGLAWYLNQNLVFKVDYRRNLERSESKKLNPAAQDYVQLGVGMFF